MGNRSPEEDALPGLLAALVEQFEKKAYPTPAAEPKDVLRDRMEHNGLKAADLADISGGYLWRILWAAAHACPTCFPANARSARTRRAGWASTSACLQPYSSSRSAPLFIQPLRSIAARL
jgi:hypothetical protein